MSNVRYQNFDFFIKANRKVDQFILFLFLKKTYSESYENYFLHSAKKNFFLEKFLYLKKIFLPMSTKKKIFNFEKKKKIFLLNITMANNLRIQKKFLKT